MKKVGLLLIVSLIVGPVAASPSLDEWVGQPIAKVVKTAGYPSQTTLAPSGNKLYVYSEGNTVTGPSFDYRIIGGVKTTIPGVVYQSWCNAYFEVDAQGIIVATSYTGNACGH